MTLHEGNAGTERFLILTREAGPAAANLVDVLDRLGRVEVIVDRDIRNDFAMPAATDCRYVFVTDDEAEGYGGLMSTSGSFPKITAWSRAMVHLARTLEPDEAVWFVEDDVAGDAGSFAELVSETVSRSVDLAAIDLRTRHEDSHWSWWGYANGFFEEPKRGFQPLCRLSARLVRTALDFRDKHGQFTFHEVLFPSLAWQNGMNWLNWSKEPDFQRMFGTFRYRPEVKRIAPGVSHPVKDLIVHEGICRIPPTGLPRLSEAVLQGWSILWEDYLFLARLCRKHSIKRVAEFGPGDSTLAFLDAGCRVISYEHDAGWQQRSVERFAGEDAVEVVHCPEGTVPDSMPFEPEIVFVDGPPFREGQEMSRLQPCEWALERCGCFLLHDTKRAAEQSTLAEMERRGMSVTRIPTRKGLALVVDPRRRPELIPATRESMTSRFQGHSFDGWFVEDFVAWSVMFGDSWAPVRALETGVAAGVSANLMLDKIFTHPDSEVHEIELYVDDAVRVNFEANALNGGHTGQIHLYEGTTREVLAWMIAGDGFWESFDFIHLNGTVDPAEILADACQAWSLLKSGGVLVLGVGAGGARVTRLLDGGRVAVMKARAGG